MHDGLQRITSQYHKSFIMRLHSYIVTKVNIIGTARSLGTTCSIRILDIEGAKQTQVIS